MVERVLQIVGLDDVSNCTKMNDTQDISTNFLDNNTNGAPRVCDWNYRSVVRMLSYFQAIVRPNITFAVQRCARFCNDPHQKHKDAVKQICCYFLRIKDKDLVLSSDKSRGLECFVDADWSGSWQDCSSNNPLSANSRSEYVIMYAGCPIIWALEMQTLVSLSTNEAEYIALSSSLRKVISILNLLKELESQTF